MCLDPPKCRCRRVRRRPNCWWWCIGLPTFCQNFLKNLPQLPSPPALSLLSAKTCRVLHLDLDIQTVRLQPSFCLCGVCGLDQTTYVYLLFDHPVSCSFIRRKLRFIIIVFVFVVPPFQRTLIVTAAHRTHGFNPSLLFPSRKDGPERQRRGELQRVDQQAVEGGAAGSQLHRWGEDARML